ncbi:probable 6-phosphogluconolactonase 2 isoform X2 [Diospyros lotus]|uniref:probable 6-phosphogluconolactonase 2 isoform X2 n=1 Tax=Diospyros lotus TaxID=55363 RepID=UPI0022564B47|nr:probable 6-phosphogluconolactonase 2 isoform X2 [Diospyros lotus]
MSLFSRSRGLLHIWMGFALIMAAPTRVFSSTQPDRAPSVSMAEPAIHKGKVEVEVFDTEEILAVSLAKYIADLSEKYTKERGRFTVVLSGGSLIDSLRKLLEAPYVHSVDWSKWQVFWLDERVVGLDSEDSNYKLAYDGFLSKVPIPPGNVHAINGRLGAEGAAKEAAVDYEARLKHLVHTKVIDEHHPAGSPIFHLNLMGMGPDGHVASLFPEHPQLHEKHRWITFVTDSPKPPPKRITMTFPVINSSAYIAMVVTGKEQAHAVSVALGKASSPHVLPVQMVRPAPGELTWFLDKAAASQL